MSPCICIVAWADTCGRYSRLSMDTSVCTISLLQLWSCISVGTSHNHSTKSWITNWMCQYWETCAHCHPKLRCLVNAWATWFFSPSIYQMSDRKFWKSVCIWFGMLWVKLCQYIFEKAWSVWTVNFVCEWREYCLFTALLRVVKSSLLYVVYQVAALLSFLCLKPMTVDSQSCWLSDSAASTAFCR